jgi:hypothetical protein
MISEEFRTAEEKNFDPFLGIGLGRTGATCGASWIHANKSRSLGRAFEIHAVHLGRMTLMTLASVAIWEQPRCLCFNNRFTSESCRSERH